MAINKQQESNRVPDNSTTSPGSPSSPSSNSYILKFAKLAANSVLAVLAKLPNDYSLSWKRLVITAQYTDIKHKQMNRNLTTVISIKQIIRRRGPQWLEVTSTLMLRIHTRMTIKQCWMVFKQMGSIKLCFQLISSIRRIIKYNIAKSMDLQAFHSITLLVNFWNMKCYKFSKFIQMIQSYESLKKNLGYGWALTSMKVSCQMLVYIRHWYHSTKENVLTAVE